MTNMPMNATVMPGMGMTMPGNGSHMASMGTAMPGMGPGSHGMSGMGGMDGMGEMGNNSCMGGMMSMFFQDGITEYILFKQLHTNTRGEFASACIVVFVVAILYEVLKFLREEMLRRHNVKVAHILLHGSQDQKTVMLSAAGRILSRTHLLQTLLHAVQIFVSYCLMLVFMTYNAYLALSLILGATLGYFITGWKRTQVNDLNENCH
ncbi:high affinity copper uptake protein 1-like [Littorina saxatilis]|uniref:Copper transport protein n=1 Tax=Littorina saxatilis TaxID=31220 RepID=A0AAN9AXV6_9CAEN